MSIDPSSDPGSAESTCMKKIALILAGLMLAFLAGRAVIRGMASAETKIRWLVQEEVEAFNATRIDRCMEVFAPDYQETTASLDRSSLQRILLYVFQKFRDRESREFIYSLAAPDELVDVVLRDEEETEAEADFKVVLSERGVPVWSIRVQAELFRGEDGWRFVSSQHSTVEGARPGG